MHKKLFALVLVIALAIAIVGPGCAPASSGGSGGPGGDSAAPEYTWRFGYPESMTTRNQSLELFTYLVNAYTGGRVKVDYFGNGVLGSHAEIFDAVQAGDVEMGCFAPYVDIVPGGMLNWMNWTVSNYRQAAVAYDPNGGIIFDVMTEAWHEVGFKLLWSAPQGAYGIANTKNPLTKPSDFDGWKFRVSGSLGFVKTMQNMGKGTSLQLETIPWADLYQALQTGVVDGCWNIWPSMLQERHYEVIKYYTPLNFGWDTNNVVINEKLWNSLPGDLQQAIKLASIKAEEQNYEAIQRATLPAIQKIVDSGVEIYWISDAERAVFREAANMPAIWDELARPWLDSRYPGQNMTQVIQDELARIIAETPTVI
jgi:C4-dicarboxylate-binding protein DctP